ncbi:unnamed protein product [Rotaria sp. Silwood1]|nr:unnamed protein product [Rotaria sp. Silwood1]
MGTFDGGDHMIIDHIGIRSLRLEHSVWWELIKELRFSIQCGASNRKALIARRCSQCTVDNDDIELM